MGYDVSNYTYVLPLNVLKNVYKWYYKYTSLFYLVEKSSLDTTH